MTDDSVPNATDRRPSYDLTELGLVGAGGALGAVARALIGAAVTAASGPGFAATRVVNLSGAFALGLFTAALEKRGPRPRLRAFVAVGFLGAFTTFSALVGEVRGAARGTTQGLGLATDVLDLTGSLALGLGCFWLGRKAVERVGPRPRATDPSPAASPTAGAP